MEFVVKSKANTCNFPTRNWDRKEINWKKTKLMAYWRRVQYIAEYSRMKFISQLKYFFGTSILVLKVETDYWKCCKNSSFRKDQLKVVQKCGSSKCLKKVWTLAKIQFWISLTRWRSNPITAQLLELLLTSTKLLYCSYRGRWILYFSYYLITN